MSIVEKSVYDLREDILSKKLSVSEVLEAYIEVIEGSNDKINAVLAKNYDGARQKAKELDDKLAKGEAVGALAGIPIIVKDNISTKNITTTCASKILENYIPIYDATVIENLKAEDAII